MTTPFSEELISAYLDGECSPDEKREVERQLEISSTAREQLKAFTELSQSMGTFTVVTAPADFRSSVLAQLPEKPMVKPTPPRRYSVAWWRPIVAVCLLLGLGTIFLSRTPPRDNVAVTTNNVSTQSEIAFDDSAILKANTSSTNGIVPDSIEAELLEADPSLAMGSARTSPAEDLEAPAGMINMPQVVHVNELQLKQKLEALGRQPSPGEVLSIIDNSEETPVMVEFTVVDVMDALGKVNVLLREHKTVKSLNAMPTADQYAQEQPALTAIVLELDNAMEMTAFLNKVQALDAKLYLPGEKPVDEEASPDAAPATLIAQQDSPSKREGNQNFTFPLLVQQAAPVHRLSGNDNVEELTPPQQSPTVNKPMEEKATALSTKDIADQVSLPPAPALPEDLSGVVNKMKMGKKVRAVLLFKKK